MSRNTTVTVGTTQFHISRFDPFTQLALLGDLQRELLPSAGGLLGAILGGEGRDEAAVVGALRDLSTKLGGESLRAWADRLLQPDQVSFELEGREPQKLSKAAMGMAFQDFSEVLELMFHVLRHNFEGPLVRWAGRFGPARVKPATPSDDSILHSSGN